VEIKISDALRHSLEDDEKNETIKEEREKQAEK
jgi:hypothetical protein